MRTKANLRKPDVEALCSKWQRILRLQDWDVKITIVRAFDMGTNRQGEVSWVLAKKSAGGLREKTVMADLEVTVDIRCMFVEQLGELLGACHDLIGDLPGDPRLSELRRALENFTHAKPFEVPVLTPCAN